MANSGQGMQIVKVLDNHSYQLDENMLEQVLLKKEIKDIPVAVISVAGAYRGGKSFLLNFFLRYLMSPQSARQDGSWLGEGSAPLIGFNWRGGSKRNTTGILLWSDPVIVTLPSGEKVAVLLMDTQGTFDSKSTVRDNSTIFALSTLISSVQIYNLSMNIQEDDLQHLQLFTMYGKMVQEKNIGGKAFQILEFLVRDWPYSYDYAFGANGGKQFIEEKLQITPEQPKELQDLRTHIRSSFEKVLCFLMPHPGFNVQNPNFKGNISEIDPNFRAHLIQLVPSLLSVDNLTPKIINEQRVKAGDLFNYFKTYMNLFNSDQIPNPKNILQATIEAGLLSTMNEARDLYEKGMDSECGPTKPAIMVGDLLDIHHKYLGIANAAFTNKKTMASKEELKKYTDTLNRELENRRPQFEQSNLSKIQILIQQANNVYEEKIRNISNNQPLCLHPLDLEKVHHEAVQEAMKLYDARIIKISNKLDQNRSETIQGFEKRYMQLKLTNEINNQNVIKDLQTEYSRAMETKSVNPPISDADFRREHDLILNKTLSDFQNKRNRTNSYPADIYKEDLVKTIMTTFSHLHGINLRKIEQERIRIEQEQQRIAQEQQRIEQERIKAEQDRIRAEQERIAREQELQRLEQERQRIALENERIANERRKKRKKKCLIM